MHDRTEWQDPSKPVTGPASNPGLWQAVVYHYPGMTAAAPTTLSGLYAWLRATHASYLNSRGYSLGYNFAIGVNGDVVEVRGLDLRNAANNGVQSKSGVSNYNQYTVAVIFVVSGASPATPAQLAAAARLQVEVIEAHVGRPLRIEGHGDKDVTPCPGAGIAAQLNSALTVQVIENRNPINPPEEEDDMPKLRVIAASDPKNDDEKAWFVLGPSSIAWCRTASQLSNGRRDGWYVNTTDLPTQEYTVQQIKEMCNAMLVGARPPGF